jgi:hypothetical protein
MINPFTPGFFKRAAIALGTVCILSSCTVIRSVQVDSPTSDCVASGQSYCHDTLIRTSIWKKKNVAKINGGCTNGLSRVKVTTKPGDIVLGFITVGLVVKQRIQWDCAQRAGSTDL